MEDCIFTTKFFQLKTIVLTFKRRKNCHKKKKEETKRKKRTQRKSVKEINNRNKSKTAGKSSVETKGKAIDNWPIQCSFQNN